MRIAIDSVSYAAIGPIEWPDKIGYVNGRVSAWTPQQIADSRERGQLIALVDVLGNAPHDASILDFERGDVQSPAVLHAWVQARNQYRGDAAVYCAVNSVPVVLGALRGEKCNLWVVDLTDDGEPPFAIPQQLRTLPAGVRLVAIQYVLAPRSGGDYDMSLIYADDWHPETEDERFPQHPVPLAAITQIPAAVMAVTRIVNQAAESPIPVQASAPVPGPVTPATPQSRDDPGQATAAAQSTVNPQSSLNHDYISRVLGEAHTVAGMFRGAEATNVADFLDRAAAMAAEIGAALKMAGL